MLLAIGLFLFGVTVSVGAAWIAPWQVAFYQFMTYSDLRAEMVTRQVSDRIFNRAWMVSTAIGSTLLAVVALVPKSVILVPLLSGVIVIVGFAWVQGFRLFREAVAELGLEWPPRERR